MATKRYLKFFECDFTFGDNPYTFDQVYVLEQANLILNGPSSDGIGDIELEDELKKKLSPKQLDTLIKVVAKINGVEHTAIVEEGTIGSKGTTINISEIKLALNKYNNIKVTINGPSTSIKGS